MATTVEFELKELLEKLDSKIDRLGKEVDSKIDKLDSKIDRLGSELNARIDKLDSKVDRMSDDINKLNTTVTRLDEQVANAVKRIDSIEFANRAISIGLLLAILGGLAKLLGFAGKPL
jgi:outer membrane murein-binding lipoprotein Lpp